MNSGAGFRSTARRNLITLASMSEELSALRQRVERLEELLEAAAGGEEAVGDRINNHEAWLEEVSIDKGEARIRKLEGELQGYDLYDIEQGVENLEKQLAALSESLAEELEVIRRDAKDSNEELTENVSELSSRLETIQETIQEAMDDQAKKVDELSSKFEEESAEQEKQLTRGKTGLQEVRRDVFAADSQLRSLEQQQETQESQIDSLQSQLNEANAQIIQLQYAVARPAFADQLLGCMLALTLLGGFIWLAIKIFYWIAGLFR